MNDREQFEVLEGVLDACADLPTADRLLVLQVAWLSLAHQVRSEALAFPGEFQAQQARQLEHLEKMAFLVREDAPDIELERLTQEEDFEGVLEHLRKLGLDDPSKG